MCTTACIDFGERQFVEADIKGKRVIEVGSRDVNGTMRPTVERFGPTEYLGIDLEMGPGVDELCSAYDLVERYGAESFDVVISGEVLEHVHDWRRAISQMKRILKPGGILVITTRSIGFPYHEYPFDYWRYEIADMKTIFSDMSLEALEPDPLDPGVFLKARKPSDFAENDLSQHALYSMVTRSPSMGIDFTKGQYFSLWLRTNFVARKMKGLKRRLTAS